MNYHSKDKRIIFACSPAHAHWGSTYMRSEQLIALARPYSPKLMMELKWLPRRRDSKALMASWALSVRGNSIVFFTKHAIPYLTRIVGGILRAKGCLICADYVDGNPEVLANSSVDVHVASSVSSQRKLRRFLASSTASEKSIAGEVLFLPHAADIRLQALNVFPSYESLKMVYFGSRKNCLYGSDLESKLKIMDAGDRLEFRGVYSQIGKYNVHYCIRPEKRSSTFAAKPPTKIMTACVCRSVPLVTQDLEDAVEILGSDFPYLLKGSSIDDILEAIEQIEYEIGGPVWQRAIEATLEARHLASGEALARALNELTRLAS